MREKRMNCIEKEKKVKQKGKNKERKLYEKKRKGMWKK